MTERAEQARRRIDLAATPGGRRVLFAALYLCEGAPIGFLWWALPTVMRSRGADSARIGSLLGILVLPWALKFLWAPLVDRVQGPRFTLRGWIASAQALMVLTLVPLLFVDPARHFDMLAVLLVLHALFASTQDAAIDALLIQTAPESEHGRLTAWMQVGMLTGRSLLGGGALLVLDRLGDRGLIGILLGVLTLGILLATVYRAPSRLAGRASGDVPFLAALTRVLRRRTTWIGLAFAATAGAGFEAFGGFAGPLLTDAARGDTDVAGRFFLLNAVLASAAGGLMAGALSDRVGPRSTCAFAGVVLAGCLGWALLAIGHVGLVLPSTAVYLAIGAFTTASYTLFLAHTDRALAATQFSAFMAATNLCESWSVSAAGHWLDDHGPRLVLGVATLVGLASLAWLIGLGTTAAPNRKEGES